MATQWLLAFDGETGVVRPGVRPVWISGQRGRVEQTRRQRRGKEGPWRWRRRWLRWRPLLSEKRTKIPAGLPLTFIMV